MIRAALLAMLAFPANAVNVNVHAQASFRPAAILEVSGTTSTLTLLPGDYEVQSSDGGVVYIVL